MTEEDSQFDKKVWGTVSVDRWKVETCSVVILEYAIVDKATKATKTIPLTPLGVRSERRFRKKELRARDILFTMV